MIAQAPAQRKYGLLSIVLRLYLTIAVPVLLTIANVRLIMTPAFLWFEYTRADFPADYYGLTTQERLDYAPYAVEYLLNDAEISYLGDLRFPDGTPMYNERELSHMVDVKVILQGVFLIGGVGAGGAVLVMAVLWRQSRASLRSGLLGGSLLTIGIIATIVILAITSWDFFFTQFHRVFFAEGTWVFLYSDTLIRLFPEQFWFDAALLIGGLTTTESLIILAPMWRWHPDI
jgi:integral membrane protein (TIGR01906 family)